MSVSISELQHRTVLDAGGRSIGEVDAVFFDPVSWRVTFFRVKIRRDLAHEAGVHASMFRSAHVDVPTAMIQSIGDAVLLAVGIEALQELPAAQQAAP